MKTYIPTPGPSTPAPNGDEKLIAPCGAQFFGNFHKTLEHDRWGEVVPNAYNDFKLTCETAQYRQPQLFEQVGYGKVDPANYEPGKAPEKAARLVNPAAGLAREQTGPDPTHLEMIPAPGVQSLSTVAEMVELYWMARLRDVPLASFGTHGDVGVAVGEVASSYQQALEGDHTPGRIRLGQDLPAKGGSLAIDRQSIFRGGLPDEHYGPLVSQFFIRPVPFGTQTIDQRQRPYHRGRNHLTSHAAWLEAQNAGYDRLGNDYAGASGVEAYLEPGLRHISTMRDLARFVHRDALHQAYFNAALLLLSANVPRDEGNPYRKGNALQRSGGFATLGDPHLLTLVSEVASRALKVVWRQKWLIHRRLRPEAYAGLVHMQQVGLGTELRDYGLPASIQGATVLEWVREQCDGGLFLPMAFSSGSPAHPAYGAGHATVAGACVTMLKAWFDDRLRFTDHFKVLAAPTPDGAASPDYREADAGSMTIGGELNKLAANVAMGRSMGGVHWRSDNTRSLRLGERIAIEMLRRQSMDHAEVPLSMSFTDFDGRRVTVVDGNAYRDDEVETAATA